MEKYLLALLFIFGMTFLLLFFIFSTAVAAYLKIFIQKRSGYKEFIVSKYTGGISNSQFKSICSFYIFYDFFILIALSFMTFAVPAALVLQSDNKSSYFGIGLFIFLIFLLVIIIPIDELKGIAKPRGIWPSAPEGIIMIWQDRSKFGYIYNFFLSKFIYIILSLFIFSLVISIIFGN